MEAYINGKIVKLTEEQKNEFIKELEMLKVPQEVTDKDRIFALENALADLAILLANNENIKED